MVRRMWVALTLLACAEAFGATQGGPIPVPLPLFPGNNWWNTDISSAPADLNSDNFIAHINTNPMTGLPLIRHVHGDWGGDDPDNPGNLFGFPYILVNGSQTKLTVMFDASPDESDGVDHQNNDTPFPFYPIPSEAISQYGWIEGGPSGDSPPDYDRHMLIVDTTNNYLYEIYHAYYDTPTGFWHGDSGAFFDMNTNNRRPDTWTSADAAGLAILPGLVRYDEVYGPNEINHAFRFTVRDTNGYVYPASHQAGSSSGALPMGARLRLKSTYDISAFPADVQKIMRALKKYGLIVADNGSDMFIQGNYDNNWDMGTINSSTSGLGKLTASDFEVVQQGWAPTFNFILALPGAMGSGDVATGTLTVYDSNYNLATGYTGTVHFSTTDGSATLPSNYTFVPGDNGSHSFTFTLRTLGGQTVYATDTLTPTITGARNVIVGPNTPTNLTATATSTTNVSLTWTASTGANLNYEIVRLSSSSPSYATVTTVSTTSFGDTVTAGPEYVYKVRAVDASSRVSPFSVPDAASTMTFTDDPVFANSTAVKAVHVTDLRQAANLLRAAANMTAFSFTDASLAAVAVKTTHIQELRTAISQARSTLGLPTFTFTDPALTAGATAISATHVQDLRNAVK